MSLYDNVPDDLILAHIKQAQQIQKFNPPKSIAWKEAAKTLKPLFAEMARRYPNGAGPRV
jgi:hypothetical protein